MTWLTYVLIILATFRLTRFMITDMMPLGWLRERFLEWLRPSDEWKIENNQPYASGHWGWLGGKLHYLLGCPWCMSIWVGAGVVYVFTLFTSVPLPVAVWLSASALTGLLANLEDKLSQE